MKHFVFTVPLTLIRTAVLILAVTPGIASAAGYMKLGDIKGESYSADGAHDDWIVVESVNFGAAR